MLNLKTIALLPLALMLGGADALPQPQVQFVPIVITQDDYVKLSNFMADKPCSAVCPIKEFLDWKESQALSGKK